MAITPENQVLMLKAFREDYPQYYHAIPEPTLDNVLDVNTTIANNQSIFNDFLGFFNKVAEQYFTSPSFENPLSYNKRDTLNYGNTIEEVFVGLVESHLFKGPESDSIKDLFTSAPANTSVAYHKRNRAEKYKVTIQESEIKRAMISPDGLSQISERIINSMSTSNEIDEYRLMKALIEGAYMNGQMYVIEVGDIENDSAARGRFLQKAREMAGLVRFPNRYNALAVENTSSLDRMTHYVPVKTASIVDTYELSRAFNMDRTDLMGRQIQVDRFADDNLVGAFVDDSFFVVQDTLRQMTNQPDASELKQNFWLHIHQIISRSPFATAIAFVKEIPTDLVGRIVIDKSLGVIGHYDEKVSDGSITVNVGFESFVDIETPDYTVEAEVITGNATKAVTGKKVKITPNENSNASDPVTVKYTIKFGEGGDEVTLTTQGFYSISEYFQQPEE